MENSQPIIVEQILNASISDVWDAITELDQMKQWFFENIPYFKPEIGFETKFNVHSNGRDFMHLWKITEVVPEEKITYNWKYEVYEGDGLVTFELFEEKGQTMIRLTNLGLESFPRDIPEFSRESCEGGWDYFIRQRLKYYIEKAH